MHPSHLMRATPGYTEPNLTELPLGTEGEMTAGPDEYIPYDDPDLDPEEYVEYEGTQPMGMDTRMIGPFEATDGGTEGPIATMPTIDLFDGPRF